MTPASNAQTKPKPQSRTAWRTEAVEIIEIELKW